MGRTLAVFAALGLSLQPTAATPAGGREVVICTAGGPRAIRLDEQGRPVAPAPTDKSAGCAHLGYEPRRHRSGGGRQG